MARSNIFQRAWADIQRTLEDAQRGADRNKREARKAVQQLDDAERERDIRRADPSGRTVVLLPRKQERQQVEGG